MYFQSSRNDLIQAPERALPEVQHVDPREMRKREIYGSAADQFGVNYEKDKSLMSCNSDWRDSSQKHPQGYDQSKQCARERKH